MVDAKKLKHARPRFPHSTVQFAQVPILALGTKVGTFLPLHVPEGWRGREGGDWATQTSNSEHEFIFYGTRVPNSMPPRIKLDKKDPVRVLVTRCRLPGGGPGPHQAGPTHFYINTCISLRGIKFRPFLLYLVTAKLSPPVCDIPTGG